MPATADPNTPKGRYPTMLSSLPKNGKIPLLANGTEVGILLTNDHGRAIQEQCWSWRPKVKPVDCRTCDCDSGTCDALCC